ncbi:MAG: ABC transporter ATP-binding protein [Lentimicrobiaceae bacterium]|nr:ABC transporter ATP-binding protein [Lentimicrobiaceae bacterium]
MKDFKHFLGSVFRYRWYIAGNMAFNLLYVLTSFFSITLIAPFVSVMFGMIPPVESLPGFHFNVDTLLQYAYYYTGVIKQTYGVMPALVMIALAFVGMSILSNAFRYGAMYCLAAIRSGIVRDLRVHFYTHMMSLPLSYFSEQKKGDLLARVNIDMGEVETAVVKSLQSAFMEPLYVIVFVIGLFAINPGLSLVVLLAFPVILYVMGKIGVYLKRKSEKTQMMLGQIVSMIEEAINGLRVIKSFNLIDWSHRNFSDYNKQYVRALNGVHRRRDLSGPLTEILLVVVTMAVLGFGGLWVLDGRMSADMFVLYILLLIRIISPAKHTVNAYYNIQKGRAALKRIYSVINEPAGEDSKPGALSKRSFDREIVFEDVSFSYADSDTPALEHVNLRMEKGKTYAFVGASGAGKTTMVDLLCRFYEPDSGRITIDGVDIADLKREDLRELIGTVSQFPFVWHDTVANNIRFGKENVSDQEVEEAARKANAHEFISRMPEGYGSLLGDNGMTVSGGQRQRITIARAILKNAPVLVLDEATSALDTESEVAVQQALSKLMENRTSIVVAHRLSTIRHADNIVVFEKGRVVEQGTHDQLMSLNGHYARYVALQSL